MTEFNLKVTIRVEDDGSVNCWHDFPTVTDRAKADMLGGGATQQIAHALLIAAMRREAYNLLLADMSTPPSQLLGYWMQGEQRLAEKEMTQKLLRVISKVSKELAPSVAQTIFSMVATQSGK